MALKIELDARAKKMESILAEANAALVGKNGAAVDNFSALPGAIDAIEAPAVILQDKTVTENGVYTADGGYDGLGEVTVEVAGSGDIEAGIIYDEITDGSIIRARVYGPAVTTFMFANQSGLLEVTLPENIDSIRSSAFYGCGALPAIELPDTIVEIAGSAFYNCKELVLETLPAALESIGASAFYNCYKLTVTELPASLKTTKNGAFYGCTGLTSVTFKGTPESLSSSTFNKCTNIAVINVPWAEDAVANAPWGATNATINYNYTGGASE